MNYARKCGVESTLTKRLTLEWFGEWKEKENCFAILCIMGPESLRRMRMSLVERVLQEERKLGWLVQSDAIDLSLSFSRKNLIFKLKAI